MEESEKSLSAPESDPSLDDEAGPPSDVRPATSLADEHPANDGEPSAVSDKELRAFLGQRDVQKRIRAIVDARVSAGAPVDVREEIVQETSLAVLTSRSRPRSMDTAPGWLAIVTVRAVAAHFRAEARHRRWQEPDVDVEELPDEPGDVDDAHWLIAAWLTNAVAADERDQETYELLVYKARTGRSYGQVAADHGMSETSFHKRLSRFKTKYLPRHRRRQQSMLLVLLLGAAAVAIVAWAVLRSMPPAEIGPDPSPPVPRIIPQVVPSVTASAPDAPFEPAAPTRKPKGPKLPPERYDQFGKPIE
jgi:DNA-directed RNA polymerase specialized sigma24 family protein